MKAIAADELTVKTFNSQCASCHGKDGKGDTSMGKRKGVKDWTDPKVLKDMPDDKIFKILREGITGEDGKERMPPAKKDTKIDQLVKYVHELAKGKA